jgi:hypothetical protein
MKMKELVIRALPDWLLRLALLRNTHGWLALYKDILSDKKSIRQQVAFESNLFFIAGLPKSGTTWLEHLLDCTPGLVQLNKSILRSYPRNIQLKNQHDLHPDMLDCVPKNKLSFLKLHLNPFPRNYVLLDDRGIKVVVIIRDLRDMLISRYHHIISEDSHWDHQRLKSTAENMQLFESMKGVSPEDSETALEYYSSWIAGWIDKAKVTPNDTIIVRYEDLKKNTFSTLKKIYDFYGYQIEDKSVHEIITQQANKHKSEQNQTLRANLLEKGRFSSTFRKGIVGEWNDCFNPQIKALVKDKAGNVLISAGYEKDFDW